MSTTIIEIQHDETAAQAGARYGITIDRIAPAGAPWRAVFDKSGRRRVVSGSTPDLCADRIATEIDADPEYVRELLREMAREYDESVKYDVVRRIPENATIEFRIIDKTRSVMTATCNGADVADLLVAAGVALPARAKKVAGVRFPLKTTPAVYVLARRVYGDRRSIRFSFA